MGLGGRLLTGGVLILVVAGGVRAVGWGIPFYNELSARQERVEQAWAQVETEMQRRYDLIPNLLAALKDQVNVETGLFHDAMGAFGAYQEAKTPQEKQAASTRTETALRSMPAYINNLYPHLTAGGPYTEFRQALEQGESRIAARRQAYNEAVGHYNEMVRSVSGRLVATLTGMQREAYDTASEPATQALAMHAPQGASQLQLGAGPAHHRPGVGGAAGAVGGAWSIKGTMQVDGQWTAVLAGPSGKDHNVKRGSVLHDEAAKVVAVQENAVTLELAGEGDKPLRVTVTR